MDDITSDIVSVCSDMEGTHLLFPLGGTVVPVCDAKHMKAIHKILADEATMSDNLFSMTTFKLIPKDCELCLLS